MTTDVRFNGRLNKDDKILPPGDYHDARNITIDRPSATGGDSGEIKTLESINYTYGGDLTGDLTDPSIIAETTDPDGNIYVLVADATNAVIWKIDTSETTTWLVKYDHNSASITTPDFRFIENTIIWNYYEDGVPLSWLVTRAQATVTDFRDIAFIKAPPIYPPVVTEFYSSKSFSSVRDRQFQFAARYIWDTGDVSALSPITGLYGGKENISSFKVELHGSEPSLNYIDKVELLYREGNSGVWNIFSSIDYGETQSVTSYIYNSTQDEEADFTVTSGSTQFVVNTGSDYQNINFINPANPIASVVAKRTLTGLPAGNYSLIVPLRKITKTSSSTISATISLKDVATDTTRASVSFDETEAYTTKIAEYTIPSTGDYYILIEISDAVFGYNFVYFAPITLIQEPDEAFGFHGQSQRVVPDSETAKQFDFVPYKSQAIAIEDNRVFLGNNEEIKTGNEGSISIAVESVDASYGAGSSYPYTGDDTSRNGTSSSPSLKGYTNNSRYSFGLVYFDDYLRTRGVEAYAGWKSPIFDSVLARVTITKNTSIPSWAKYYQLVRTKNLDKDFVYEGWMTGCYFAVEQASVSSNDSAETFIERRYQGSATGGDSRPASTGGRPSRGTGEVEVSGGRPTRGGDVTTAQNQTENTWSGYNRAGSTDRPEPEISITSTPGKLIPFLPYTEDTGNAVYVSTKDLQRDIKYFVIDISAMFQAELPYNYQPGDIVIGHFESQSGTSERRTVELDVIYQEGSLIYCNPSPILELCDSPNFGFKTVLGVEQLLTNMFEIYSPSRTSKDQYFAVGDMHPISELTALSNGASLTKDVEGDVFWREVSLSSAESSDWTGPYDAAYAEVDASTGVTVTIGDGGSDPYPKARFDLDTEIKNYLNNNDFSIEDNVIKTKRAGVYRVKYTVEFTQSSLYGYFTTGVSYATADLVESSTNRVVASCVYTGDGSAGAKTITTTALFEAFPGESYYLAINGRQYGIGGKSTEAITFNLRNLIIGHGDSLVGDFAFGLIKKPLSIENKYSMIFKAVSPSGRITNWHTDIGKPYTKLSAYTNNGLDRRIRFGGKKLVNSEYSRLHSFDPLSYRDISSTSGSIVALEPTNDANSDGGVILAICKNSTHSVYVGVRMIQSPDGTNQIVQSSDVLGSIRELAGSYGAKEKSSVAKLHGMVFWWDENNKSVIRYTREGLFPVSAYKMNSFFNGKTSASGVIGFIDPFYRFYHIKFAGDTYSTAFDMRDKWVSHFDIRPSCRGTHFDNYAYLASGTQIYRSLGTGYTSFMGVTGANPYIQLGVNFPTPLEFVGLGLVTDSYLDATPIETTNPRFVKANAFTTRVDTTSHGGQYTEMDDAFFSYEDGVLYSHIFMDQNGSGNQYTGMPLSGSTGKIKITFDDSTMQHNIRQVLLMVQKTFGHNV